MTVDTQAMRIDEGRIQFRLIDRSKDLAVTVQMTDVDAELMIDQLQAALRSKPLPHNRPQPLK